MPDLIFADWTTGQTLYGVIRNSAQEVWYDVTPAFEAFTSGHWLAYDVAFTEQTGTGRYTLTVPAGINTAGFYDVTIYQQAGGSPSLSADFKVGTFAFQWSGSAFATGGVTGTVDANIVQISGDADAADNLEKILDGTGGVDLKCDIDGQLIGDVEGKVLGTGGSAIAGVGANVNVTQISDDATAANNAESFFDGTGYGPLLVRTTVTGLSSQTVFNLSAGSSDNDAYNGATIVIEDASTAAQKCVGTISDYVGATKTVTLAADPGVFTIANSDVVTILAAGSANVVRWNGLPVAQEDLGGTAFPHVSTKFLSAEQLTDEAAANFETFFGNNATPSTLELNDLAALSTFDPTTQSVDVGKLNGSTAAAVNLAALYAGGVTSGTIDDSTPTASGFTGAAGLSSDDNAFNGLILVFTSGPNAGRWRKISTYVGSTRAFSFGGAAGRADAPFPEDPTDGDAFLIGGRSG